MKYKTVAHLLVLVVLGVLFAFCSRPKEVLSRKKMEKLMYDVYLAEAMIDNDYRSFDTPQKKEALINEVFRKHKVSPAQWDSSLSWYSDRVQVYLVMNDSVRARLQRQHKATEAIMNHQMRQEQAEQHLSPSYIPRHYSFDAINPKNGFRFRLDTTEIAKRINNTDFDFSFNVVGIPENSTPNLRTVLMLEYKDTTIYRSEFINENRNYSLHAQKYIRKDTINDTIRNITGFVRLQDSTRIYRSIRLNGIVLGNPTDSVSLSPNAGAPHPEGKFTQEQPQRQMQ